MGIHGAWFKSNNVVVHIHYSTVDAVFRTLAGKPVAMEFHRYLGPSFYLEENDVGWMPKENSEEWKNLWKQFDGWWEAKGKSIYTSDKRG